MSLLNCFIAEDRALVAVDTCMAPIVSGNAADLARRAHGSKILTLPHANVVLAARGEMNFFNWLASDLNRAMLDGYDAMAERMQSLLEKNLEAFMEVVAIPHGVASFPGAEILMVGWSRATNRMQAAVWKCDPGEKAFRVARVVPWMASPNPGYAELPSPPSSAERMTAIARDQVDLLRSLPVAVAVGGRLLLAELTRDSISIQSIADLEVHP
ncbi:hypothetical protein [Dyella telluris]|uniref:Uncharacterized protein n=1 Tax=Dyella telluris TaxID=2763498 RepID=A0A7G8Q1S1_9GAMM|nr:hypothetical protein [Dyella telluris]QNK00729.1 hypothetical protein H8F01_16800 [Dyella telluris]